MDFQARFGEFEKKGGQRKQIKPNKSLQLGPVGSVEGWRKDRERRPALTPPTWRMLFKPEKVAFIKKEVKPKRA